MKVILRLFGLLAVSVVLVPTTAYATDIGFCGPGGTSCSAGCFTTSIATAVAMAPAGGTVFIKKDAGIPMTSQVTINKNLTILVGNNTCDTPSLDPSPNATLTGTGNHRLFLINTQADVALANLTLRNGSDTRGGLISVEEGSQLSVSNSTLTDGVALGEMACGGAIHATGGSTVSLRGIFGPTILVDHSSGNLGGAVCLLSADLNIIGEVDFRNNTAENDGGGIHAAIADIFINGFLGEAPKFTNNVSTTSDGGAISIVSGTLDVEDALFGPIEEPACLSLGVPDGNLAADDGGAIVAMFTDVTLGEDVEFCKNKTTGTSNAPFGGAVAVWSGSFTDEGALYTGNQAFAGGGAVFLYNSTASLMNSDFSNNTIKASGNLNSIGGAIFVQNNSSVTIEDAIFNDNDARFGGAIAVGELGSSTLDVTDTSFNRNDAALQGGALFIKGGDVTLMGVNGFQNSSDTNGGFLSIKGENSPLVFLGGSSTRPSNLNGNNADKNGGHITVFSPSSNILDAELVLTGNVRMVSGSAGNTGGAIQVNRAVVRTGDRRSTGISTLWECSPDCFTITGVQGRNGGGIAARNGSIVEIARGRFINNGSRDTGTHIRSDSSSSVSVFDSEVRQGFVPTGGLIGLPAAVGARAGGVLNLINVTIAFNMVGDGAIYGVLAGTSIIDRTIISDTPSGSLPLRDLSGSIIPTCTFLTPVIPAYAGPPSNLLLTSGSPLQNICLGAPIDPNQTDLNGTLRTGMAHDPGAFSTAPF